MQYGHHGAQKSAATSFFPDTNESHSISCVISLDIQNLLDYDLKSDPSTGSNYCLTVSNYAWLTNSYTTIPL
jgi:hypothetical protein